jgi:cytochrome oxidase assembly protein ShyY1
VSGARRTWLATLLLLIGCALCVRLGFWQWQRGSARQAEWERFARGSATLVELGARALASVPLYQHVRVSGTLDAAHQFLLDNRSWQGHPGYEVLTPLHRDGAVTVLVDRGWVPFTGSRAQLPPIGLSADAELALSARVGLLPSAGLALGHAAPAGGWPAVTAFPTMDELARYLGEPLEGRLLLLDAAAAHGYVRDWQAPGLSPVRHFAYALQWWCFATLALGAALALHLRRRARGAA